MSPLGPRRVLDPGVLPQAAWRPDVRSEIWPDEVRVAVDRAAAAAAPGLGVDRIFGKGTTPSQVAGYLAHAVAGTAA